MDIQWNKPKIATLMKEHGRAGMATAGEWVKGFVMKSFLDFAFNYYTGRPGSPEGGPPRSDTGRLRRSITHKPNDTDETVGELIGGNVEYAARLEFGFHGTDKAGRNINQGERPYLRPAVYDHQDEILKAFVNGAKKGGSK